MGRNKGDDAMTEQYKFLQEQWLKEEGLVPGSTVTVTCTAANYERGWNNVWINKMNDYIGEQLEFVGAGGSDRGIILKLHDSKSNLQYRFPYFVLSTVSRSSVDINWDDFGYILI